LTDVGFGLIVVVVTHEEFDRIVREEFLEFAVELAANVLL